MLATFDARHHVHPPREGVAWPAPPAPWRDQSGDPTTLSGKSPEIAEANALCEAWRERVHYLKDALGEPERAARGVVAIHQEMLAEIARAAAAGETSTLALELEAKRDASEALAKSDRFAHQIHAAEQLVEQARAAYVDHLQAHYR